MNHLTIKRALRLVLCATVAIHPPVFAGPTVTTGLQRLAGGLPRIDDKDPGVQYDFDLSRETFYVHVPKNHTDTERFGMLVFMSPGDESVGVPPGWEVVLENRKLIYIAPQRVGNQQPLQRRIGLAVVSACKLAETVKIDPARIYIAGLSGGGRMAAHAAFHHPDLFSGVFAVCGVDFCHQVPRVKATRNDAYGWVPIAERRAAEAKRRVRFALVTGSKDFRYGNILDIYQGGFLPEGYNVKLFDVPGMEHTLCSAAVLDRGIRYFDLSRTAH